MRHKNCGRKLNRNSSHRKSMFRNMLISFINYENIRTTLAKAKELRILVERVVNISFVNNISNRRLLFSRIRNKIIVNKLFNILGPKYINFNGGYTRILKCGFRNGDNSPIAYIEFV